MHELINENGWVWVLIQDPGKDEQYVGQHYKEENISFVPAFVSKEDALACQGRLSLAQDHRYEVQAIHHEDLVHQAAAGGFVVFLLDAQGTILDRMLPS